MSFTSPGAMQRARACARLAKAQDGICPACGQPLPEDPTQVEIDHIIPRSRGGPSAAWNKRLVHLSCNRRKSYKLTAEAVALADEHGIVLTELKQPRYYFRRGERWV